MQDILRLRILLAAAALVLWSASAASAQARLWVIRDADSTIYLMGTVHLLRPGTEWRSPKIDAALKEATELWLETPDVDPSPQEEQAFRSLMLRAGMSTGANVVGSSRSPKKSGSQIAMPRPAKTAPARKNGRNPFVSTAGPR